MLREEGCEGKCVRVRANEKGCSGRGRALERSASWQLALFPMVRAAAAMDIHSHVVCLPSERRITVGSAWLRYPVMRLMANSSPQEMPVAPGEYTQGVHVGR